MAEETGGKAYFPSSTAELNGIAKDIASELRTQFSIGYLPSNDRKDGTYQHPAYRSQTARIRKSVSPHHPNRPRRG
ncbi:MAG: hypothetical protein M9893_11745 [Pyrinomonadaceae bacterium]|nr:hypothetical protein [Pyrinomonadaceae bacterium]